ncbi:hypothetical protein MPNTM1_03737 [Mycolicibacterium parafortuitum]|uniref:hypothetical protein n=1 Tax=Mycolicibacterium parafortuitum TaxID=39692 RepID=UPI0032C41592
MSTPSGDTAQFGPNAAGYTWVSAYDVPARNPFPGITHPVPCGAQKTISAPAPFLFYPAG